MPNESCVDCVHGGDIDDQDERSCQCVGIIQEVGLSDPFSVAVVVSLAYCRRCAYLDRRSSMDKIAGMDPTGVQVEGLPKNLQAIPPKTIFKVEELKVYMTSYMDGQGKLDRKLCFVLPDGRMFTTEKEDIPLTGVTPWYEREMLRNLKGAGVTFKPRSEG